MGLRALNNVFKVRVERLKVVAVFIPELVQIHGYVTCVDTQGTKVRRVRFIFCCCHLAILNSSLRGNPYFYFAPDSANSVVSPTTWGRRPLFF